MRYLVRAEVLTDPITPGEPSAAVVVCEIRTDQEIGVLSKGVLELMGGIVPSDGSVSWLHDTDRAPAELVAQAAAKADKR
jgi:hypothetical protein